MPLEGSFLLAKPAMRPRMVLRALRPPMIFGASLPGMIFPAQRPAEGSNSYHYGSYATMIETDDSVSIVECFHTTMVLTQQTDLVRDLSVIFRSFHTTMVLTQQGKNQERQATFSHVSIPLWFLRNRPTDGDSVR